MADVGQPRDPVTEWEDRCEAPFAALKRFASRRGCVLKRRDDGVLLADTHNRNFIRTPDGSIVAIDVQPRLQAGFDWDAVMPFPSS